MDTSLMHADIFFFVTTIFVVIVGLLVVVALIYLLKILHRTKKVVELIHEETALFREDIHDLRDNVRREGFKLKTLFSLGYHFFNKRKNKKSKDEK